MGAVFTPVSGSVVDNVSPKESVKNLIDLYEAWNKPEKAEEWRAKLKQIEDFQK
ncbi:hypothetical protein ACFL5Z_05395 [Planctomycetota bacterium]